MEGVRDSLDALNDEDDYESYMGVLGNKNKMRSYNSDCVSR